MVACALAAMMTHERSAKKAGMGLEWRPRPLDPHLPDDRSDFP